ncbi:hypothetical protein Aperf_G00000075010 [Anoplocephala perfoliata]
MDIKPLDEMVDSEDTQSQMEFASNGASSTNENALFPNVIQQPYYLETFLFIISEVLNDPFYDNLFDIADRIYADKFLDLSDKSKIIYLILFRRSRKLHRLKTIRLPEQVDDNNLDNAYDELKNAGFLSSELVNLASSFKLPLKNASKKVIIKSLLRTARAPSLLKFFSSTKTGSKSRLRTLAERSLGECFSVEKIPSNVLLRILFCFSLTSEKFGNYSHPISFETLLSNELYVSSRIIALLDTVCYRNSDDLSRYFEFAELRHQLDNLTSVSKFNEAYDLFTKHAKTIRDIVKMPEFQRDDLPRFLKSYTLPNLAIRIVRIAISVCERLRKYEEAVGLIQLVLSSNLVDCVSSKSVCFLVKRLLLDQGSHCHDKEGCLKKVLELIPLLREIHCGHRLDIQRQLGLLTGIKSDNDKLHLYREPSDCPQPSKKRKIVGRKDSDLMGQFENFISELVPPMKSAPVVKLSAPINVSSVEIGVARPFYLWKEMDENASETEVSTSILHVEEWALKHYLNNIGFEKGVHCESSIYTSLCGLLFYDLIYGIDRPDAFYSMRQSAPLDLFSGDFYSNQNVIIEARLEMIYSAERTISESGDTDPVSQILLDTWKEHNGEHCFGINWELFADCEAAGIVDLFWCLGPKVVASFCRLLISDYSNWHSGLPDLCVWSPSTSKSKLIEVKGPGDTLSSQQIVWIDKLISFGADVEICSVAVFYSFPIPALFYYTLVDKAARVATAFPQQQDLKHFEMEHSWALSSGKFHHLWI